MVVDWPPSVRFFDRRSQLLNALKDQGLVSAFRWSENVIGARLGRAELLEVSSQGALVVTMGPDARLETAQKALMLAIESVGPEHIWLNTVLFQYILPLDTSYDEARKMTGNRVVGNLMPQAVPLDWSLLVDGRSARSAKSLFQVEFGVIDEREAPDRLARRVGRVHSAGLAPFPEDFFDYDYDYPGSALFFDWRWTPRSRFDAADVKPGLFAQWAALAEESEAMCEAIQAGVGMADEGMNKRMEAES